MSSRPIFRPPEVEAMERLAVTERQRSDSRIAMFLDEAIITVRSGSGGGGIVSFRREKYIPRGGPDGGDGGRGASVYLRARSGLTTLNDVARRAIWKAPDGRPGRGNNKTGRSGKDIYIDVPVGTIVRHVLPDEPPGEGRVLGDLVADGDVILVARGGRGGRGNKSFATATYQAPREAEEGEPGAEKRIYLELKLLADVGLIGLPNAGKSTLLRMVSAATPKVADYPFTTLTPHLGIAAAGGYRSIVFADIPGLLEGAHRGVGLGTEFLRHVERTKVLVHLVSAEPLSVEEMERHYRTVEGELAGYSPALAAKPRIVAASKLDLVPAEERQQLAAGLASRIGTPVVPLSSVIGLGVKDLVVAVSRLLWPQG